MEITDKPKKKRKKINRPKKKPELFVSSRYLEPRWSFMAQDKNQTAYIEGISVKKLAEKYGTPVYIMVESEIRTRLRRFKAAFPYPKLEVQYASKCNSNLEILRIMREEGLNLDASSAGELILGLLADFEPKQMMFTNLYKSEQDIMFAAKLGIQAITIDSIEELKRVIKITDAIEMKLDVFLRVNPIITLGKYTSKHQQYGIPHEYVKTATNIALNSNNVNLVGYHFHGSYIENWNVYLMAAQKLLKLVKYAMDEGAKIRAIDLGGGFPVKYSAKKIFTPEDMGVKFIKEFRKLLKKYDLPEIKLIFEPGKFFVANSGVALVRVVSRKNLGHKKKVITDGSTYAMLPDPLVYKSYYDIFPATKMGSRWRQRYDICGCTCDCIDILGKNRYLPTMKENDLLAIMDCGAYSNVMASNFNTLKRPPMILVREDGSTKLIRRRDRYSEMFSPELDVLKIAAPSELKALYNLYRVNLKKMWGISKNGKK